MMYGANPFPEAVDVASYIRAHSAPGDQLAVLGSEPEIYFYSRRHSATGFIYVYGLTEKHEFAARMRRQMIREVESAKPRYVVFTNVYTSWLTRRDGNLDLLNWAARYTAAHYHRVGIVDMIEGAQSLSYWGEDAEDYTPSSRYQIHVFERNTEPDPADSPRT